MTDVPNSPAWEPPLTGTDAEQVLAALDRQRSTFRWKTDGLDGEGLIQRIGASSLTLGGLLNHLAFVEDLYSGHELSGIDVDARWHSLQQEGGWTAHFSPEATPEELTALYDSAVARSRERIAEALERGDLEQATHMGIPEVGQANLRRLLLDLLEEYGRHTGHADLLRESVDGRVGEDPPVDWVPPWSRG